MQAGFEAVLGKDWYQAEGWQTSTRQMDPPAAVGWPWFGLEAMPPAPA